MTTGRINQIAIHAQKLCTNKYGLFKLKNLIIYTSFCSAVGIGTEVFFSVYTLQLSTDTQIGYIPLLLPNFGVFLHSRFYYFRESFKFYHEGRGFVTHLMHKPNTTRLLTTLIKERLGWSSTWIVDRSLFPTR